MQGSKRKAAGRSSGNSRKRSNGGIVRQGRVNGEGHQHTVHALKDQNEDLQENRDDSELAKGSFRDGHDDEDEEGIRMLSDEDMDGGFEDVAAEEEPEAGSSKTGYRSSLYSIPSRDEMSTLRSTSELYKSNIFKLKVEEMVSHVQPRYEKSDALDFVLRRVKATLESLDDIEPQPLRQALHHLARTTGSVQVPFPEPSPKDDSNIKFGFVKPSRTHLVGSWIMKTAALRPEGVDVNLVVTMPSSLFQEKDHLNMRYFHKKAFYLAVIASALAQEEDRLGFSCEYSRLDDDSRRPTLVLKARKGAANDFTKAKAFIKIHLAYDSDVFPVRRLSPGRNNMRIEGLEETEQPATPCYNAALLLDGLFESHLIYLNTTKQLCPAFAEACILLKTWSLQRFFGSGMSKEELKGKTSSIEGRRVACGASAMRFVLTMLLAHLLHGPEEAGGAGAKSRLSPAFSSYQLFRGTIDFLASHDFSARPVHMKGLEELLSRRDKIDAEEFRQQSELTFVDPTGSVNLLQNVHVGTMQLLQAEAKATLALLNDSENDHFDELFLRSRSRPSFFFDDVLRLDLKSIKSDARTKADHGSPMQAAIQACSKTLTQAMNTRAAMLTYFPNGEAHWRIDEQQPKFNLRVEAGIIFIPSQAFRLVDHGPRPEDQSASELFKQFWGEKAELRRFRDGRIIESVVWSVEGFMGRYEIPKMIIRYILQRHHGIDEGRLVFHSDAYYGLLEPDKSLAEQAYLTLPSQNGFQTIQSAFDELVKSLRGLQGLPLSLISVVAADAGLRGMSVMVPSPINRNSNIAMCSSHMPVHDFVMTLESSGRWPDDLVAIQAMKMAFYETMARKLADTLPSCQATVVLDVDAEENEYWDHSALEVILSSGLAFRGRIHHERERLLLQRVLDEKHESVQAKSKAKNALERFETRFDHDVRHHSHMAALAHRFVSMAEAVRLFKRWISCQMFGLGLPEVLCELLVASVYISASEKGLEPSLGHAGFLQTLQRLAEWNWREEPLTVAMAAATAATPTATVGAKVAQAVKSNFEQMRRLDPGLNHFVWFIATEEVPKGCSWGRSQPSSGTADAIQQLARGACNIMAAGPHLLSQDVKSLFIPSLSPYAFLIHLEPAVTNRYLDNINVDRTDLTKSNNRTKQCSDEAKSKYRNFAPLTSSTVRPGLDVGKEFVLLLQSLYLDSMRLYYDPVGGVTIGGLFNPSLNKPRAFRVGLGFNSVPVDNASKEVVLNKQDIVAEIERLGRGIVKSVEVRHQHL